MLLGGCETLVKHWSLLARPAIFTGNQLLESLQAQLYRGCVCLSIQAAGPKLIHSYLRRLSTPRAGPEEASVKAGGSVGAAGAGRRHLSITHA